MAAAVRMKTWSCPTTRVFYPRTVLFIFLLSAIEAVVAAPEPGVWKISVGNVSITRGNVYRCIGYSWNISISYVSRRAGWLSAVSAATFLPTVTPTWSIYWHRWFQMCAKPTATYRGITQASCLMTLLKYFTFQGVHCALEENSAGCQSFKIESNICCRSFTVSYQPTCQPQSSAIHLHNWLAVIVPTTNTAART